MVRRPCGIARRHHLARRLVVAPQPRALGAGQGLAVDLDAGSASVTMKAGVLEHLAVDLDAAGGDPALGVAARAQAGARQPLGDALVSGSLTSVAAALARKARKSFASPSEIRNSGCHCTPMQKR